MDGQQFDDLTRGVSEPAFSRRELVLGLVAAAAGLLLGVDDAAASKRRRRRRRNRRGAITICSKGRQLTLDRAAARELISRGAQPGLCQQTDPGADICPVGIVPCSAPPSDGSTPACCGPNSVCVTCNPGGDCICCPAVGGSCPSCQAPSFVCCSSAGDCSCCAADQRCNSADGSCININTAEAA